MKKRPVSKSLKSNQGGFLLLADMRMSGAVEKGLKLVSVA
jgi:hypothetical protein